MARADWDGDGDIDFLVSNRNAPRLRFLRNDTGTSGRSRSVSVKLVGTNKTTNRDAIGAVVSVRVAATDPALLRFVDGGNNYGSQGLVIKR